MTVPVGFEEDRSFKDIKKPLRRRRTQFAPNLKLDGVLCESRAERRPDVHNAQSIFHSWKGRAHKRVWSKQQMIVLVRAASLT